MLSSVCRLCCKTNAVIPIFDSTVELAPSQKIIYCCNKTKINIEEDDDLSKHICMSCSDQLSKTYNFILQCEAADKKLRERYQINLQSDQNIIHDDYDECSNISYQFKVESSCYINESKLKESPIKALQLDSIKYLIKSESQTDLKPTDKISSKKKKRCKNLGPFICETCGKKHQNNSSLLAHLRSHSDKRAFKCLQCDKTYKDPSNLKRHNEKHHMERTRNFVCDNCGKCFYDKKCLQVHSRTHTGETPYACKICPAKFTQRSTLVLHNRRHTGEKPYQCLICQKRFFGRSELNVHAHVHSGEKKFKCSICDVEYKRRTNLTLHMARHVRKEIFVCDLCGKSFDAKIYLANHIERKHSAKSGFCEVCCQHVSNLEMHMHKHTGYRGSKCEYCDQSFFNKKGLSIHMVHRHSNQQFKCTENGCEATFSLRAKLNYHVTKVHNLVIPFPCDKCSRGFYRLSDYVRHKKRTHKDIIIK